MRDLLINSTIILMTLLERDKYGYEIIDEVLSNTNGKVSIKQPSLYSSLKRMEEQSLISSYWRDSEIGGKRHYYHLTDFGKKNLEKWKEDLPTNLYANDNMNDSQSKTRVLQQENLFNLGIAQPTMPEQKPVEIKKDDAFVQFDLFSNALAVAPPSTQNENEKFCGIPRCRRMRRMNNETLLIILISILAIAAISTAFYYLNPLCNPRAEEMITSVNYD